MRIRATVVKALAAGALLVGVAGTAGAQIAGAVTINNFYVAPNGSDSANSCTNKSAPCQTIAHAISQMDLVNSAGPNTLNVGKGTYPAPAGPAIVVTGQSNLTIQGAVAKSGKIKSTIETAANEPSLETSGNTNTVVSGLNLIANGGSAAVVESSGTTFQNSSVGATAAPGVGIDASGGRSTTSPLPARRAPT